MWALLVFAQQLQPMGQYTRVVVVSLACCRTTPCLHHAATRVCTCTCCTCTWLPLQIEPIDSDSYFTKNTEFAAWLKEAKGRFFRQGSVHGCGSMTAAF